MHKVREIIISVFPLPLCPFVPLPLFLFIVCLACVQAFSPSATGTAAEADEQFQAGAARKSIVPTFPTQMGGFFDRSAKSTGVDVPIYARALVCDNGAVRLAVVTTDLIGLSRELVETSRKLIEEKTGISAANVMITATHTHSAPSGFQRINHYGGGFDEPLFDFLVTQFVQVVVEANARLVPARVGFGAGELERFSRNRQQENEAVIDSEIGVLKVTKADSRDVIAIAFNFTGHPVVLGSENLLVSGEFPGHAAITVEAVLGGVALPLQGACGDITVHRSGDPYQEVRRLGHILAGEVIKTAEMTSPADDTNLLSRFVKVKVQSRKLPSPDDAEKQVMEAESAYAAAKATGVSERRIRRLDRDVNASRITLRMARFAAERPAFLEDSRAASVHVLQIGPLVMVGIPGELFVEYALEMKQRVLEMTGRPLMVIGYANDYIGYIITPRARHTGGYEQSVARVDDQAGRVLTEAAMRTVETQVR